MKSHGNGKNRGENNSSGRNRFMKRKKKRVTLTQICAAALNGAFCNGMYGGVRQEDGDFGEDDPDGSESGTEDVETGGKSLLF